jgi:predicted helicase
MLPAEIRKLCDLTSFEALIDYLRDDLDWPIEAEDAEKVAFDYNPQELGIDPLHAVKIETIRQIRPLAEGQPWGVFYVEFESKQLPVLVLRRILHTLVPATRRRDPNRPAWKMSNLLFISSQGTVDNRSISFAHFHQTTDGKQELRTFSWDVRETHLYYIKNLNLNALRWPRNIADVAGWSVQWESAFTVAHRYVPTTAQMLAEEMARIARDIREAVNLVYSLEHVGGPMHQLHLSLKMDLISDLSEDDFADMYAQTVTYGLFAARATRSGEFHQADASALIAHTNPFLHELLEQMMNQQSLDLDGLGVTELTDLLVKVNMEAILRDFGRQKHGEDPVIHFYETFMRAYDPKQKTKRGEFYTPDPVVSFIVRSVDYLLRTDFGCKDGFATPVGEGGFQPVVLDPATGTGTFLKYVIEVIWETFYEKNKKLSAADRRLKWNEFVRTYVLPRLYAFELKMSPYTIAHMKVGLELQQLGFDFHVGERLRIYLTNSLQPAHEIASVDTYALAHEAELANVVKNNVPVTVVIGNPPYSGHSANASRDSKGDLNFIGNLLQDYYKVDGKPLGEKNPKWLQDDYVKFIRFAQWRIEESGVGIVAMITNHGYLDNPTFRGMRQQLLKTFDDIYILDLHGNSKKRETAPDGSKDENVFDIQQGVAICLMVKRPQRSKVPITTEIRTEHIFHADLFGLREYKYEWMMTHHEHIGRIDWKEVHPQTPFYLFIPQKEGLRDEYESCWKIIDIMPVNTVGIVTGQDSETISMYLDKAKELANKNRIPITKIQPVLYRPFDMQYIVYDGKVVTRPRLGVMNHMLRGNNIALVSVRQVAEGVFNHALVTKTIMESRVTISNKGIGFLWPLYLYTDLETNEQHSLFTNQRSDKNNSRKPNFSQNFILNVESQIGRKFDPDNIDNLNNIIDPEDIFHYIYAILHSPVYRRRYAEFLKMDFPRIPLTSNLEVFLELCTHGNELVALHMFESPKLNHPITKYIGNSNHSVANGFPKFQHGVIWINSTQGFEGVPENVWNFQIGGYQVCHKWLKDRRGQQLSQEDIVHYQKIVVALNETIRLMGEIDDVIDQHGGWPIRYGVENEHRKK